MVSIRQGLTRLIYSVVRPQVLKSLDELDRVQWLSGDEVTALQHRYIQDLLEYAYTYVPYYQELFKEIGFRPSDFAADPTSFSKIPLLTKEIIRQNHDRLITTEEARRSSMTRAQTGGTTGEPLWFWKDPTYRNFNTAYIYQSMEWSGFRMGQPQFWLWGHVLDRTGSWKAPFKDRVGNWIANRFDSDAFVLTQQSMEKLTRQIEMHPDGVLWSYVSIAYRYAQFLQERGHNTRLRGVCVAAEPLFDHQRQFIQEVLGCPVFDNYSSIDTGAIARECEQHSGLHIAARNCYVEVLRDGKPVPDGEDGEFVLTNLTNFGFPVIRYKIEDWGRKSTSSCICGRGEPMLEVVEGRMIDLFKTRDGRTVYGAFADPLMPTLGEVMQFQVIQKSLDLLVFYIVADGSISEDKLLELAQISKGVLGENVEIKFEFVDHLPSTPTGKHRFLISEVE